MALLDSWARVVGLVDPRWLWTERRGARCMCQKDKPEAWLLRG